MKSNHLFLIVILLIISNFSYSQNNQELIQEIRDEYNKIESGIKNNAYTIQEIEYECSDANEYGHLRLFFSGDTLINLKIYSVLYEENGETIQYYFKNSKLFFVFHESQSTEWVDENEQIYHYCEVRSYYSNEQAFRCLTKGYKESEKNGKYIKAGYVPNKEIECRETDYLNQKLKIAKDFISKQEKGKVCFWR